MSTSLFGLIGKKLGHSFSKKYFSEKFRAEGIEAAYELFELAEIRDFMELVREYPGLKGLNVTVPYKTQVIPYLHRLSPEARAVGAVNTIKFEKGFLSGHNTDIIGFRRSLEEALQGEILRQAIVLGTGGASKAVNFVLKNDFSVEKLLLVSRKKRENCITYEVLREEAVKDFSLIVNTTPLGMYPDTDSCPDFPYEALGEGQLVFDLIYNPEETLFMQKSKTSGARVVNGMGMLIYQAEAAWKIWNT